MEKHECIMSEEILESFRRLHTAQFKAIQRHTILLCLVLAFLIINMSVLINSLLK